MNSRSASVENRNTYREADNREFTENRQFKSRSRSIDRSQERRGKSPIRNKDKGNVLYVGNLDRRLTDAELKERFEKFGKLESIQLIKDPNTQECRGFAFVEYANYDDAEDAIKDLDQKEFDGRKLRVERSKRGVGYERTPGQYLGNSRSNFGGSRGGYRRDRDDRGGSRGGDRYHNRDRRSRSRSRDRGERRGYGGGGNGGRYGGGGRDGGYGGGDRDRPRGDRYNDRPPRQFRERSRSRERERRY